MAYPKLHLKRNCAFFLLSSVIALLYKILKEYSSYLGKEENITISEAVVNLSLIKKNRFKTYFKIKDNELSS